MSWYQPVYRTKLKLCLWQFQWGIELEGNWNNLGFAVGAKVVYYNDWLGNNARFFEKCRGRSSKGRMKLITLASNSFDI